VRVNTHSRETFILKNLFSVNWPIRNLSHDFTDVRIVADGSPLTEYHEPEAGDDEGRTHTRHVEAMTDQRFGVFDLV
jgi:hypothetical protein